MRYHAGRIAGTPLEGSAVVVHCCGNLKQEQTEQEAWLFIWDNFPLERPEIQYTVHLTKQLRKLKKPLGSV